VSHAIVHTIIVGQVVQTSLDLQSILINQPSRPRMYSWFHIHDGLQFPTSNGDPVFAEFLSDRFDQSNPFLVHFHI
jgi:hypothetical protein